MGSCTGGDLKRIYPASARSSRHPPLTPIRHLSHSRIMFERNLFQSRFGEFIASTYGKAVWMQVMVKCGDEGVDASTNPDESNARWARWIENRVLFSPPVIAS